MNFYITKLHIWFKPEENRRTITFENNKVNVITGSSSKGKSNILAIIDYCLLSTRPRIVYPVINEYAEWYGLEFVANGKVYAIARKKPVEDTAESNIYRQNVTFTEDFYPSTPNIQISDLRRELDLSFSLKEDYRAPHVIDVDDPRVSFRSFLIYNALTETIMTNPHNFTDFNFFDKGYVDEKLMRDYLFDVLLGLDKIQQGKKLARLKFLEDKKEEIGQNSKRIQKYVGKFNGKIQEIKELAASYDSTSTWYDGDHTPEQWIEYITTFYEENTPTIQSGQPKELIELKDKLNYLAKLKDNVNDARKEINSYLKQQSQLIDSLKPVEYLLTKKEELGSSYWTTYIIDAFEKALKNELNSSRSVSNIDILQKDRYENLLNEIEQTKEEIRVMTNKQELSESQRQEFFYFIGRIKSYLDELNKLYEKTLSQPNLVLTNDEEREINDLTNETQKFNSIHHQAIEKLNGVFQGVYDDFKFMEYYEGCKTKYDEKDERLMLNRGVSAFNEENIGSQSNYMFLHLCFFLGLHKYLIDVANPYIGQFLFIDQPSIPYYAGSDNVKTTDKEKLLDAFESINNFMHYVIDVKSSQFQVILIEHAPESYWIDENTGKAKESLDYFLTAEKFEGDNALIPITIVKSTKDK